MKYGVVFWFSATIFLLCGCNINDKFLDLDKDETRATQSVSSENVQIKLAENNETPSKNLNEKMSFSKAFLAGLQKHPDFLAARASEVEGLSLISSVESAKKFKVSGKINAGGLKENTASSTIQSGLASNLTLSKYIFDGGLTNSSIDRQTAEYLTSKEVTNALVNKLGFDASAAWVDFFAAKQQLDELRKVKMETAPYVESLQRMSKVGLIDRTMSDKVQEIMLQLDVEKQIAINRADVASIKFQTFFGFVPENIEEPKYIFDTQILKDVSEKADNVPDVRIARANLLLAKKDVAVKTAEFSPKVNFEAGYSSPLDPDETGNGQLGLSLSYIFNDGGKRISDLEASRETTKQMEHELNGAKLRAVQSMKSDIKAIELLESSLRLIKQKRNLASKSLKILKSQLQTGQANHKQLIEAQIDEYKASLDLIDKSSQLLLVRYQLAATIGLFSTLNVLL